MSRLRRQRSEGDVNSAEDVVRELARLRRENADMKRRIRAAIIHLERALTPKDRHDDVRFGDTQLAMHALRGPLSKPQRR